MSGVAVLVGQWDGALGQAGGQVRRGAGRVYRISLWHSGTLVGITSAAARGRRGSL